ncbi:PorP/SprF family type IX secretion system membrane protein [Algoriphagus algorifonticola]|uniref:PorP/SprF family type IX secretion system membrane protein n=1 Tax=Algoriphagus algorifonticola TaxID=2593007 RepID=UPI001642D7B2|nr:type IX secretion system membrane protein PorP/SprF [Algoriphagus algorifonticola]
MRFFKLIFATALTFSLFLGESKAQQIPQYSQYLFNPIFINPAYSGYQQRFKVQSYFRKQWTGVNNSPETFAIAADTYLDETNLGVGGQLITDRLGAQRTTAAFGNISYHLRIGNTKYISFGAGAGLINSQLDGGMLSPDQDNDPSIPASKDRMIYPDVKFGAFLYDENFYLGVSGDNMVAGLLNLDQGGVMAQPIQHLYVTGGYHFDLTYSVRFIPSFMYMDDFKSPARLDLNSSFIINDVFWLGAGYRFGMSMPGREAQNGLRKSTAVIGLVQLEIMEGLRLGYAYDHTVTRFSVGTFTTHDISITYLFPPKKVRLLSPRFF